MTVFEVDDPLGNRICLHAETWQVHIVAEGHPEMRPYLAEVELTVREPREIWTSKRGDHRLVYYRELPLRPHLEVAVVADLRGGSVCTAYLHRHRGSRGGKRVWP